MDAAASQFFRQMRRQNEQEENVYTHVMNTETNRTEQKKQKITEEICVKLKWIV